MYFKGVQVRSRWSEGRGTLPVTIPAPPPLPGSWGKNAEARHPLSIITEGPLTGRGKKTTTNKISHSNYTVQSRIRSDIFHYTYQKGFYLTSEPFPSVGRERTDSREGLGVVRNRHLFFSYPKVDVAPLLCKQSLGITECRVYEKRPGGVVGDSSTQPKL